MKNILPVLFVPLIYSAMVFADENHNENYYNERWCEEKGGEAEEYIYKPYTRTIGNIAQRDRWLVGIVDCVTDEYAVEAEWSYKWKESVGQSLLYAELTHKKPAILIIRSGNIVDDYRNRARLEMTLRHVRYKNDTSIKVFFIDRDEYDNN